MNSYYGAGLCGAFTGIIISVLTIALTLLTINIRHDRARSLKTILTIRLLQVFAAGSIIGGIECQCWLIGHFFVSTPDTRRISMAAFAIIYGCGVIFLVRKELAWRKKNYYQNDNNNGR